MTLLDMDETRSIYSRATFPIDVLDAPFDCFPEWVKHFTAADRVEIHCPDFLDDLCDYAEQRGYVLPKCVHLVRHSWGTPTERTCYYGAAFNGGLVDGCSMFSDSRDLDDLLDRLRAAIRRETVRP